MPFPLLLLLLVGGAAVVAASSSAQSEPEGGPLRLKAGAFKPAGPLNYEKFRDPVLVCLEQTQSPSGQPYRFDVGLNYLDVPNTAAARVAAMRSRIGTPPATLTRFPRTEIGRLAEASYKNVQRLAVSMSSAYAKASEWGSIAKSFGIPVSEVAQQAKRIAELKLGSQSDFIREASRYAPVALSLMNAVASIAAGRSADEAKAQTAELLGLAAGTAVASVVPVVGQVVQMAAQMVASSIRATAAKKEETCQGYKAEIQSLLSSTLSENFPFPVHAIQDFGGVPCDDVAREEMLEGILRGNGQALRSLSVGDKAAIVQWWTLAVSLMSQPEVFAVFDRLGHGSIARLGTPPFGNGFGYVGRNVGLYGGVLGSDEQVMLVAAPYAVANGYDVDRFARALWDKSQGWRGADRRSFLFSPNKSRSFSVCVSGTRVGAAKGGMVEESCLAICGGADVPMNAWALNFAALSRDAAELARTLPKG